MQSQRTFTSGDDNSSLYEISQTDAGSQSNFQPSFAANRKQETQSTSKPNIEGKPKSQRAMHGRLSNRSGDRQRPTSNRTDNNAV
jgi:hypothetical protein